MKYIVSVILMTFALFICNDIVAQNLSKSEVKEIKTELKKFKKNPLLYKLKLQKLRKECEDKDEEIYELEARLKKNRKSVKELSDSITLMHSAIDILVEEAETNAIGDENATASTTEELFDANSNDSNAKKQAATEDPDGTVYKVQVGYFKKLNLAEYFDDPKIFSYEMLDGGISYQIGYFTSYQAAKQFAEDMRKMGITDAFVTKYTDGQRM